MRQRNPDRFRREHEYDYEDDFIDDSEMLAYLAADRRRTKHSGFFINKVRHPLCFTFLSECKQVVRVGIEWVLGIQS